MPPFSSSEIINNTLPRRQKPRERGQVIHSIFLQNPGKVAKSRRLSARSRKKYKVADSKSLKQWLWNSRSILRRLQKCLPSQDSMVLNRSTTSLPPSNRSEDWPKFQPFHEILAYRHLSLWEQPARTNLSSAEPSPLSSQTCANGRNWLFALALASVDYI